MALSIGIGMRFAVLCMAAVCAVAHAAPPVPERVTFESLDRDPATGETVRIRALLFKPAGGDGVRRPAVVALHGCGGMYSAVPARRERLSVRHWAMAELLVAEGYVVLFPDSFRSRGQEELCTVAPRHRKITQANRRLDAQGALAYLQARADVAADRIALLGWSHGGSAVLATLNATQPAVAAWVERETVPYFRAGVAFYPGCGIGNRAVPVYSLAAPLRLFIAGSDDWTAPQPCIDLAARLADEGEPVKITVYPDAHHGFDGPAGRAPTKLDMPGGTRPGMGVTVATDPEAKADAYARMKAYLRAWLGWGTDRK